MTQKILLVEDSPTMRKMLNFALRRLDGVSVEEAGDGIEGLKRIKEEQYDLIITDINMPLMDGLKLVSLIRQQERYLNTPIVVVTTESAEADRDKAFALGATAYLTKPVKSQQVEKKIKELLRVTYT